MTGVNLVEALLAMFLVVAGLLVVAPMLVFAIERSAMSEEAFMDLALELDAEDISIEEEVFEIYSQPESFACLLYTSDAADD